MIDLGFIIYFVVFVIVMVFAILFMSGDVAFSIVFAILAVVTFGFSVGVLFYIESQYNQYKIFYILSGVLSFIAVVRLLAIEDIQLLEMNISDVKSLLTVALATSIMTLSAIGGVTCLAAVTAGGSDSLEHLINGKIKLLNIGDLIGIGSINALILLLYFLILSSFLDNDDFWAGYFISLTISTVSLLVIYIDEIYISIGIQIVIIIILFISFLVEHHYKKKKEEYETYKEKKIHLIRRMDEILNR